MMLATQPVYQQPEQQQQQQQQQQQFSNPFHTTATTPFARTHSHSHSHYSTPTRPSPLSPRRQQSSSFSSSSSTPSTMTTPSTPNTGSNNRNLFSSPLANTTAPTDPDTPLTTFLPSSPLQPGPPSSASCFGSPVHKPFSAAAAGPLFSFHPDANDLTTTTSPIASPNNPSRFATRYAAQIANPLTNAAARTTRPYTGTSASPAARNTRRNAFLNRVKRDRADGRFENRGEQLVLLEHVAEQKRWGEAMRRSAVSEFGLGLDGLVEDDEEEESEGSSKGAEMDALDQYLIEQERGAIAAEEMGVARGFEAGGSGSFSDEDYDDIFTDLAGEMGMKGFVGFVHSQEMDMS
ncbi:hypothetical protein BO82DRAFT_358861 [Aspergillus uvarum CBS 121591]|uniref:Uncharacterized protein n=1 Tax=Aspergillus uvarum CBS 121591 TaxID=1448315 RepID=A0A319BZ46_9EURO|nr:hypothetical protein BO82DRAFT_358861 [Aspergillus uvarum CBS 121591]PYH76720.1 hypothetical protein BO82DRAFT_358861 [Aspergillus uvarum CBS 121591]